MSINLISRIFSDYHKGKDSTSGRKYRYTIEYNPLSAVHTWIIRQPLPLNLCFTPRGAVR